MVVLRGRCSIRVWVRRDRSALVEVNRLGIDDGGTRNILGLEVVSEGSTKSMEGCGTDRN